MGATNPANLPQIYKDADIALHVESFDKKYKYATVYSFSTKIIDLMASTCAIMAICWEQNNGWNYLKEEDAAIYLYEKDIFGASGDLIMIVIVHSIIKAFESEDF